VLYLPARTNIKECGKLGLPELRANTIKPIPSFHLLPKDIFLYLAPFKVASVKYAFGDMINIGHAENPSFWI